MNHTNENGNQNFDPRLYRMASYENGNNTQLRDVLQVCLDDFLKDFTFLDIHPYVNSNGVIFTEDDLQKILLKQDRAHEIILMFQILTEKNRNLNSFMNILRIDYGWLHDKLRESVETYGENKEITKYLNVRHELRSRNPKHADNNVRRIEMYAEIRDCLKGLRPWHYLVIYGELGYGKKWLGLDVCCDYSVIRAMDFKIFWLDVHNCISQEKDLENLQRLKIMLGGSSQTSKIGDYEGISNKILELQQDLKTILKQDEYKDCLLVLADVQNIKTIDTFSLPCKILITTRNKKIMEYLSKRFMKTINIDRGLTQVESVELFERVLEKESKTFPGILYDILEYSKCHPFLLNIIAQHLKDREPGVWHEWLSNLRDFRIQNDKINAVIKLSLDVLKLPELELFHTLSIFYHSVKIPVTVVAKYWNKSEKETIHLIKKFDRYSLVTRININENISAFVIHILYYNYLRNCVNNNREDLNARLVESYNIQSALNYRTDVNLTIPDDHYFHYYIGYHLRESKMFELFPKLYLDLGFLGQKLRITGLPNTYGDLKYFREQITGGNEEREDFVDHLLEFLPNIEEMIFKSDDTYLLQYMIMTNGLLRREAINQAKQFPHHAWFTDSDHFHRRRQIVPLREMPKLVKLIEPNTCLVALDSHSVLVADLSLNYSNRPTSFIDHKSNILRMVIFTENYFLSYDADRNIRVWSIERERRDSQLRRDSSLRFIVNQIDYSICTKVRKRNSVQLIAGFTQAFHIGKDADNNTLLHTALSNGSIRIQKWNSLREKFDMEPIPALETKIKNIKFLLLIKSYYAVVTKDGQLRIFNTRDGSECSYEFDWPRDLKNPINVHFYCLNDLIAVMIFVFASKAFQIRLPLLLDNNSKFKGGTLEMLYEISCSELITCSVMSDDEKYLIVGTKQGILVIDLKDRSEVLRNSISDHITCVDIYSLDDEIYKYIIISASKYEKQLNIFGLKLNGNNTLTWANSIGTFVNDYNMNLRFEPNAWLVGKQLFDVALTEDRRVLVAIDSKNRIHHLHDRKWSMILPANPSNKITAIRTFGNDYFCGCQDGIIYDSQENEFDTTLNEPIKFLKIFESEFFVASSYSKMMARRNDQVRILMTPIAECFLQDEYLVLIEDKCSIRLWNSTNLSNSDLQLIDKPFGAVDYKKNILIIASQNGCIYIVDVFKADGTPDLKKKECFCDNEGEITAIQISSDADLCAVGFSTGLIEINKVNTWQLIQRLESHRSRIYDLKFSPWPSASQTIVLASISEQICFWDITYVLNNPLDIVNSGGRHSSRFSSKKNKRRSSEYSSTTNSPGYDVTDMPQMRFNFWSNKRGSLDRQELLACVKFAGNKAERLYTNEDFTQFVTIDDEGEIYFFKAKEIFDYTGSDSSGRYSSGAETEAQNNDWNGNVQI